MSARGGMRVYVRDGMRMKRNLFYIRSPRRRGRVLTAAQSADAIKVVRKLLSAARRPNLLACGLVASVIGCTRTRHGLSNSIDRPRRYFAHPFLNGLQRTRCRLRLVPAMASAVAGGPAAAFASSTASIFACTAERSSQWAAVTRRNRGGERSCARYYRSHSHNHVTRSPHRRGEAAMAAG
jgi:hypothetical protein